MSGDILPLRSIVFAPNLIFDFVGDGAHDVPVGDQFSKIENAGRRGRRPLR